MNNWYLNTLLSRLDNKSTGQIVIVMQRVHVDDLTGFVLDAPDDWAVLKLPAIAETLSEFRSPAGRFHIRRPGEVLWPLREPRAVLEHYRRQLGSDIFAAQFQQEPMPPGGAMIKRHWVQRYSTLPPRTSGSRVIQSWDTASKGGPDNDWSVCTTWLMQEGQFYLMHVDRDRYDYPDLKRRALLLADQLSPDQDPDRGHGNGHGADPGATAARAGGRGSQAAKRQGLPHVHRVGEVRSRAVYPSRKGVLAGEF